MLSTPCRWTHKQATGQHAKYAQVTAAVAWAVAAPVEGDYGCKKASGHSRMSTGTKPADGEHRTLEVTDCESE